MGCIHFYSLCHFIPLSVLLLSIFQEQGYSLI